MSRLSGGFSFAATRNDHLRAARARHRDTLDPSQSSCFGLVLTDFRRASLPQAVKQRGISMSITRSILIGLSASIAAVTAASAPASAQQTAKPNILFIVSDDTGYGDLGPYGGGEGRGMPTPSIDRMANEGMTFFPSMRSRAARPDARLCRRVAFRTAAV